MPYPHIHHRPIARTLIVRIVLLASLCMLVMGGLRAVFAYHAVQQNFHTTVRTVAENSLHLLSTGLWDIEVNAVQSQVDWLATLPEVGWVRVQVVTGQVFTAGTHAEDDGADAIVLEIMAPNGTSKLGQLHIGPHHDAYLEQVVREVATVVFDYVIFTLLICLLVGWVLHRELQQPLQKIAHFVGQLQPNQLALPLTLERKKTGHLDEIDLVVMGFQRLQADLRHHIETLDIAVQERTRQLNDAVLEIQHLSITDPLTGCYNRRQLDEHLPAEIERSFRYHRPLSVVFADIDHFKRINDQWGHAAGDAVLRAIVQRFEQALRAQVDWVARYGGEEFLVVLPERGHEEARQVAERLRQLVGKNPVVVGANHITVTASFGVAEYANGDTPATLLGRADHVLYQAKAQGRNRVLVAAPPAMNLA